MLRLVHVLIVGLVGAWNPMVCPIWGCREANYTDPAKFVDQAEKPGELPAESAPEERKLAQPKDGEESGGEEADGGDEGAPPSS